MGSSIKDGFESAGIAGPGTLRSLFDPMDLMGTGAKSDAKKAQKRQKAEIAKQKKIEDQKLAAAESEVKRREASGANSRAGRKSLIATSQTGLASNLGGSNGTA